MKIKLEINNKVSCHFDEKKLKLVIEKTIGQSYLSPMFRVVTVSIGLISLDEIQKINCQYRDNDYPTDILSFANYQNKKEIVAEKKSDIFLGELLICCEDIKKYSKKNNIIFEKELYRVVSHGILHLLGLTHSKEMFAIQNKIADFL